MAGWSSEAELFRLTRDRSLRLTDLCAELGRDPVALRRSLVCFPPDAALGLDWGVHRHGRALPVHRHQRVRPVLAADLGLAASQEDTVFEHVMSDVAPGLKGGPR